MTKPTSDQAQASPTKRFFVSMLTRDIYPHFSRVEL